MIGLNEDEGRSARGGVIEPVNEMASFFDDYVRRTFPARRDAAGQDWPWPGDEWADQAMREATFDLMTAGLDRSAIRDVVEIGPGSGKYTQMLLDRSTATISAYELSAAFLESLGDRCRPAVDADRLHPRLIAWTDNRALLRDAAAPPDGADLFFAIDVFLMMDFQSVLTYLISAAAMLKPGGRFFATFAAAESDSGWERLLRDAGRHSAFSSAPSTRFHWVTKAMIEDVLARLGFGRFSCVYGPEGHLDVGRLYVSADLLNPMPRDRAEAILRPAGDSTNC